MIAKQCLPISLIKNIDRKIIPTIVQTQVINPATTPSPTGQATSEASSKNKGVQAQLVANPKITETYNWTKEREYD